jgi:iron-sulfur cluster assembly accessory protein
MEIIQLTAAAQEQAKALLDKEEESKAGLRIAVIGGGCSGLQYKLGWDDPSERDEVHTYENGLLVVVDEKSAEYLKGTTLEFHNSIEQQGFEVQNPNASSCCGCGNSFNCG